MDAYELAGVVEGMIAVLHGLAAGTVGVFDQDEVQVGVPLTGGTEVPKESASMVIG